MKVEIATCPCSWGVFWADGSPSHTPANVFMDMAAGSGYVGIELGPVGYLPTTKAELDREFGPRGLVARAGTACYEIDEMASFEDVRERATSLCSLLRDLDVHYLVMMDESKFGKSRKAKAEAPRSRILKNYNIIKDYVEFAKGYGVTVVYHPHDRSIVETEQEILDLMEVSGCMLCLDFGHHQLDNAKTADFGDRTAIDFFLKHHERIPFLHFKNTDAKALAARLADPEGEDEGCPFCPLSEGVIDFKELKRALESVNFDGIGVVEQDMAHAKPEESFELSKKNREYLHEIGMI